MIGDGERAILEVDARGLCCPLPVLRLARAIRSLPHGARVRLLATDPASVADVESFCGEGGADLLSRRQEGDVFFFDLIKPPLDRAG